MTDSPLTIGGDIAVTATSGAQLNAMVGNDNVVEAALDLLFVNAQYTGARRRRRARTKAKKSANEADQGPAGREDEGRSEEDGRDGQEDREEDRGLRRERRGRRPRAHRRTRSRRSRRRRSSSPARAGRGHRRRHLTVSAQDTAGIDSHSSVVQDVVTTNDLSGLVPIVEQRPAAERLRVHDRVRARSRSSSATTSGSARRTPAAASAAPSTATSARGDVHRFDLRHADGRRADERHRAAAVELERASGTRARPTGSSAARRRARTSTSTGGLRGHDAVGSRCSPTSAPRTTPTRRVWERLVAGGAARPRGLYPGIGNFTTPTRARSGS